MAKVMRPVRLQDGKSLSDYYTVEGLIRLAESRMFYMVNDCRPDQSKKYCWECGSHNSEPTDMSCISCGKQLKLRKFLISDRWEEDQKYQFSAFFEKEIEHPVLLPAFDLFEERKSMYAVYDWQNYEFLIDLSSALNNRNILDIALRLLGLIAHYHEKGIVLGNFGLHNLLIKSDTKEVLFFDPVIERIYPGEVPADQRAHEMPYLSEILRKLTSASEVELADFYEKCKQGVFKNPYEMGREIERLLSIFDKEERDQNASAMSDVGLVRVLNEDNWGWGILKNGLKLYVVADGMGGHDAGEVASSLAVSLLFEEMNTRLEENRKYNIEELRKIFLTSFQQANNGIKDYSEKRGSDMGTTMVTALIVGKEAIVANVGDSRAYLHRKNSLHQISKDHSLVQRFVDQGQLTMDEARHHPHSNILMRTVGTDRNVQVDTFTVRLETGDKILLCSDGLWGEVEDAEMESVINESADLWKATEDLVWAAHAAGAKDNVTLVLYEAGE